jgi:hypothetical protein
MKKLYGIGFMLFALLMAVSVQVGYSKATLGDVDVGYVIDIADDCITIQTAEVTIPVMYLDNPQIAPPFKGSTVCPATGSKVEIAGIYINSNFLNQFESTQRFWQRCSKYTFCKATDKTEIDRLSEGLYRLDIGEIFQL